MILWGEIKLVTLLGLISEVLDRNLIKRIGIVRWSATDDGRRETDYGRQARGVRQAKTVTSHIGMHGMVLYMHNVGAGPWLEVRTSSWSS